MEIKHTIGSARQRFWWPGLKSDVMRLCQLCDRCQQRNLRSGSKRTALQQDPVGSPMEGLAFDILSFPDETEAGNTCVLVVCDYFKKWMEAFALPDHKAVTVADTMVTEIFLRFGVPRFIHSDQVPEFMSDLMQELFRLLEINRTALVHIDPNLMGWWNASPGPLSICSQSSVVKILKSGMTSCNTYSVHTGQPSMRALAVLQI